MAIRLKPIHEQTIVITGASSGIGLTTARMAAREGARVVLAARSDQALHDLEQEIQKWGGQAVAVQCDVGNEQQVRQVAQTAFERFGGFDTWINNAGVSIWGGAKYAVHDGTRGVLKDCASLFPKPPTPL